MLKKLTGEPSEKSVRTLRSLCSSFVSAQVQIPCERVGQRDEWKYRD